MKRIFSLTILILVCYILQSSVFSFLSLAGIIPNIMLILVVSFALMRGQTEGMLVGFFCGMLFDIFSDSPFGFFMLLYLLIGYLNGFLHQIFYANNVLLPLGMIFTNSFLYNIIIYMLQFLLRNRTDFGYYFMHVIAPEAVYTLLIAVVLYNGFLAINQWLEKSEKRSAI